MAIIGKNSKEAFLKKLQICMKTYDYKDETKDVRGKVNYTHIHAHMLILVMYRLRDSMPSMSYSRC